MPREWFLRVYDNYHYQDEAETYTRGPFPSASHAVQAAREIVDAALRAQRGQAQNAEQLLVRYRQFGEDPVVIGPGPTTFSAWQYAESRAAQIFCETPFDKEP